MKLPDIRKVKDLKGKRVLVRSGLNVPIKSHQVLDDFRIRRSLLTIEYLKSKGAKVIIISHIGRESKKSLRPVVNHFNRKLNVKVGFVPDIESKVVKTMIENMSDGSVILLENLRRDPGETENNAIFAKKLAEFGDLYVNDAFSVSHRAHASIVGIPKYLPSYAGILFQEEVKNLSVVRKVERPFLFILGGAKISTKIPLLEKFTKIADTVFVGGALANDLLQERGFEIGKSLVDSSVKNIEKISKCEKLILPQDVLISGGVHGMSKVLSKIGKKDVIVDVGPKTRKSFIELVSKHNFILVNGPMGNYEEGFEKGTKKLLKVLSDSKAKVVIGGGDTTVLISRMKIEKSFEFVSTGGGAMLDFLVDEKLPGITTLLENKR